MGKRSLIIGLFILVCKGSLFASHIVGGEFELLHVSDFTYRLNMIMYFDEKNGAPGAMDPNVIAYIYRKADNKFVRSVSLSLTQILDVPYSNPSCNSDVLETLKLIYTTVLELPANQFSHQDGYYVSFERCCRNYGITNVFSNDPTSGGIAAGQTFYLEFPPVVDRNGDPFVNSTPRLFPPLRDYGCVDKFFYTDFRGTDDDGDSLVYSMVNPYSTFDTQNALPLFPSPGPYPEVVWRTSLGFGPTSIIKGDPDIRITQQGILSGKPELEGLFVFAVQCEEYRDGKRIGLMRRDFQMLVVDGCVNETPVIKARRVGSPQFYQEGQVLNFDYSDEDKCVEILVSDVPVGGDRVENVNIRAIPINFNASLDDIVINRDQNIPLSSGDDVALFTVCFPECPYLADKPYKIGLIAMDDNCPQPALDTVIVSVRVQPPPNKKPYFEGLNNVLNLEVNEQNGGHLEKELAGIDDDHDNMFLDIVPFNFNLSDYGMSFVPGIDLAGRIETKFVWDYDCQTTDFSDKSEFTIQLRLDDDDKCNLNQPEILTLHLKVNLPPNTIPQIYSEKSGPEQSYLEVKYNLNQPISLDLIGYDEDNDQVHLSAQPVGFNLVNYSASFPSVEGLGKDHPSSTFTMNLPCDYNLESKDHFRVNFFIEDEDKCQITNRDTLTVDFVILPPTLSDPEISMRSLTDLEISNNALSVNVGQPIHVRVQGVDFDKDIMDLRLIDYDPALEGLFTFEDVSGTSRVLSDLIWDTDCQAIPPEVFEQTYSFTFELEDHNCFKNSTKEITLDLDLSDIVQDNEAFIPPNIFTPNGDEFNPYFALEGYDESRGRSIFTGLPPDNCKSEFKQIVILNRWGNEVFESNKRDFRWYGKDVTPGIYYYVIQFSDHEYKGPLTVKF